MEIFVESGIGFKFSSQHWAVRKYDEHEYYQALSGAGLKGMDFVGIWKGRQLVLVEVKNYRPAPGSSLPTAEKLLEEIVRKVEDTLLGISAIRQMLERKMLYRTLRPLLLLFPVYTYEWPFWSGVGRLTDIQDSTTALLVLEGYPEDFYDYLKKQLSQALSESCGQVQVIGPGEPTLPGLMVYEI